MLIILRRKQTVLLIKWAYPNYTDEFLFRNDTTSENVTSSSSTARPTTPEAPPALPPQGDAEKEHRNSMAIFFILIIIGKSVPYLLGMVIPNPEDGTCNCSTLLNRAVGLVCMASDTSTMSDRALLFQHWRSCWYIFFLLRSFISSLTAWRLYSLVRCLSLAAYSSIYIARLPRSLFQDP